MIRRHHNPAIYVLATALLALAPMHGTPRAEIPQDDFLQRMITYSENIERRVLAEGRPLTAAETELARRAQVQDVDRVRILVLERVPLPRDATLRRYLEEIGFLQLMQRARGTTKGYGIILTPGAVSRPINLAHELIHVAQYERLGGIAAGMAYHLPDLAENGYRRSELEDEAFRLAPEIVDAAASSELEVR